MKKLLLITVTLLTLGIMLIPSATYAEKLSIPKPKYLPGPSQETQKNSEKINNYFAGGVLGRITQTLIIFAGVSAFIFLIYAGILLVTAFGNDERITSAKKIMTWAIAGLIIATMAFAITSIIVRLFPSAPVTQPGETDIPPAIPENAA